MHGPLTDQEKPRLAGVMGYGGDRFRGMFRGDGYGTEESLIRSGGTPEYRGMQGMKERTQRIGGSLLIRGEEGVGSEIELSIPAT